MSFHRFLDIVPAATGFFLYAKEYSNTSTGDEYEQLWAAPYDGSAAYAVTTDTTDNIYRFAPRLSPDGTQIVYLKKTGTASPDLMICDVDGSNETTLDSTPTATVTHLEWKPDGTKILYTIGTANVYDINPDGTGKTTILTKTGLWQPTYNADGSKIAYVRNNSSPTTDELYVMDADGSNDTQIVAAVGNSGWGGFGIAWMHNSDVIVYPRPATGQIWKINADGTGDTRLDSGGSLAPLFNRSCVTDDDSTLFFVKGTGATWPLYTIDLAGGGEAAVSPTLNTAQNVDVSHPWRENDRVYVAKDNTNWDLVSVAEDGSGERTDDAMEGGPTIFETLSLGRTL